MVEDTSIKPMRPVEVVEAAPPNPFGSGRVVRELSCLALAILILLWTGAGWLWTTLAIVFWLSHWLIWGWIGYRHWRRWRDGPPVPAGTPGGSLRSR